MKTPVKNACRAVFAALVVAVGVGAGLRSEAAGGAFVPSGGSCNAPSESCAAKNLKVSGQIDAGTIKATTIYADSFRLSDGGGAASGWVTAFDFDYRDAGTFGTVNIHDGGNAILGYTAYSWQPNTMPDGGCAVVSGVDGGLVCRTNQGDVYNGDASAPGIRYRMVDLFPAWRWDMPIRISVYGSIGVENFCGFGNFHSFRATVGSFAKPGGHKNGGLWNGIIGAITNTTGASPTQRLQVIDMTCGDSCSAGQSYGGVPTGTDAFTITFPDGYAGGRVFASAGIYSGELPLTDSIFMLGPHVAAGQGTRLLSAVNLDGGASPLHETFLFLNGTFPSGGCPAPAIHIFRVKGEYRP